MGSKANSKRSSTGGSSKRSSGTTFGHHQRHHASVRNVNSRKGKRPVTLVAPQESSLPLSLLGSTPSDPDPVQHLQPCSQPTTLTSSLEHPHPRDSSLSAAPFALAPEALPVAIVINGVSTCSPLAIPQTTAMTGLIRIYLPSSLGTASLQSAIDLLIQPAVSSDGSKAPAFIFRPIPKSAIPSMDAPHVLMDYVSARKVITMRKEMLLKHSSETAGGIEAPSPTVPHELGLGLDDDGQELVWMMEFAGSESGDSAVVSGCECDESLHTSNNLPKFVEVMDDQDVENTQGQPTAAFHPNATVFESLTELDALPPLPDSPVSSVLHDPTILPPVESACDPPPGSTTPAVENAPCASNGTLSSSPILKNTDLTPMASPTIHPTSHETRDFPCLAVSPHHDETSCVLAPFPPSPLPQHDQLLAEQLAPLAASAVEVAPVGTNVVSGSPLPSGTSSAPVPAPVPRFISDSGMPMSTGSKTEQPTPARESVDLGSTTVRTTKSTKSSFFKRFSQSFSTLTRSNTSEKHGDGAETAEGPSSVVHSVHPIEPPSAPLKKKKSKLFAALLGFSDKGSSSNANSANKKERKAREKAEKAARREAKRVAKALTA